MRTIRKVVLLLICLILTVTPLTGCDSIDSNAVIYYEADVLPETLDPQLASNNTELAIIRNIFEGLMRVDSNNEIVLGNASSYELKNNTYTFNISESAFWSDGVPVTAYDYEFAFKRAVDPETKSPYAAKLRSILNAELILSGDVKSENLGVTATNASTLVIRLAYNDNDFLYKLTTSVCMPCREDFFNSCEGQYGLSKNHLITNGSYKLTKWNKEKFAARIYRSDSYCGKFIAKNSAVFFSQNKNKDNIEKLSSSSVDIAFINMSQLNETTSLGLKNAQFQNMLWVLEVSDSLFYDLRRSLMLSFDRSIYAGDLAIGYNAAYSLFPTSITNENLDYVGIPKYDIDEARTLYYTAISEYSNNSFPTTTLQYFDVKEMQVPINDIVGHWQKNLGAYINTQPIDSVGTVKSGLGVGNTNMIIYPVTINDRDPSVLCYQLGIESSKISINNLAQLQTDIISSCNIMPIAFENTVVAYSSEIIDFNFSMGNGLIDFAYVTKK